VPLAGAPSGISTLFNGYDDFTLRVSSQPAEVIDAFADGLAEAVDCIRRQRVTKWMN
jgi:hypothetical protein